MNELEKWARHVVKTPVGLEFEEGYTEEEHEIVGEKLGVIETARQWYIGDWFNAKSGLGRNGDGREECEKASLNYQSARHYSVTSSTYKLCKRMHNLSHHHHRTVQALDEPLRTRLLEEASAAIERKEKYPVSKLRAAMNEALGVPKKKKIEVKHELIEVIEELPKVHQNKIKPKLEAAINKTINEKVDEEVKRQKKELNEREKEAERIMKQAIKLRAGVQAFMSVDEYKLVLSCLHPDRECNPERKNKAFVIFKRLEETNIKVR